MSLDVYLIGKNTSPIKESSGIFIRESGETKEITEEEWNKRNPDREPVKFQSLEDVETNEVYHSNITHNLGLMAERAGLYQYLWRPEELNISIAKDLIKPLKTGLKQLKDKPEAFKPFNPENGWGNYDGFVHFIENYLNACVENPDSKIEVDR